MTTPLLSRRATSRKAWTYLLLLCTPSLFSYSFTLPTIEKWTLTKQGLYGISAALALKVLWQGMQNAYTKYRRSKNIHCLSDMPMNKASEALDKALTKGDVKLFESQNKIYMATGEMIAVIENIERSKRGLQPLSPEGEKEQRHIDKEEAIRVARALRAMAAS